MREVLFILIFIGVLFAFTAFRYRKQILSVYQVWKLLKQAGIQRSDGRDEINSPNEAETGPLVNCAKCGTWVPESRAIKLGLKNYYCSTACLERSATAA